MNVLTKASHCPSKHSLLPPSPFPPPPPPTQAFLFSSPLPPPSLSPHVHNPHMLTHTHANTYTYQYIHVQCKYTIYIDKYVPFSESAEGSGGLSFSDGWFMSGLGSGGVVLTPSGGIEGARGTSAKDTSVVPSIEAG